MRKYSLKAYSKRRTYTNVEYNNLKKLALAFMGMVAVGMLAGIVFLRLLG